MSSAIDHEISYVSEGYALSFLLKQPLVKPQRSRAIVLLHGVGSNENDLFNLASQLPADLLIISPRGPFQIGNNRYAWYQVSFSNNGPAVDHIQEEYSRRTLIQFIKQVKATYSPDEIFIGGFSQGAIMSYSIGLTNPSLVQG
jgi:phospholipase/carboxylesterase